jgi:hypothetical protein
LDKITVNGWDVVMANSGGHKCITNISGLSNLLRDSKKDETSTYDNPKLQAISDYTGNNTFVNDIKGKLKKYNFLTDPQINAAIRQIEKEGGIQPKEEKENEISSYVELTKAIQDEFVNVLNQKIQGQTNITESKTKDKKYNISKSKLGGKGVFAPKDLKKGDTIGLLHTIIELGDKYEFTELGKMHNHNDEPNCHNEKIKNKRYLVASENIKKGEELTTDYRLQPDLEQPQEWFSGLKEQEEKMYPQKDGYRTYSPFKNLDYIIVDGNGIDCDNIVYDLILIGDNRKVKFCKKNSGSHYLDGATKVVEIPLKNNENHNEILKDKKSFSNWLDKKLEKIDFKREILKNILS